MQKVTETLAIRRRRIATGTGNVPLRRLMMNIRYNGVAPCFTGTWNGCPMYKFTIHGNEDGDSQEYTKYMADHVYKEPTKIRKKHILFESGDGDGDPLKWLDSFKIGILQEMTRACIHIVTDGCYPYVPVTENIFVTSKVRYAYGYGVHPGLKYDELVYDIDDVIELRDIGSVSSVPIWLRPVKSSVDAKELDYYQKAVDFAMALGDNVRVSI
jgi:hypothetical protein